MNALVSQLLSFPPQSPKPLSDQDYDNQIRALIRCLNSTSASKLTSDISGGDSLLNILDPALHTLPYLYTLLAHSNAQNSKDDGIAPGGNLWEKMLIFVSVFDTVQVRYCGHEFRSLIDALVRGAGDNPAMAIEPIRIAMLRLDPSTSTFTSTHLLLVHLCLQTRAFDLALPILNNDIFHFPSQSPKNNKDSTHLPLPCGRHETSSTFITASSGLSLKLRYQDHLQYFLYGAMIYIALKDWGRALDFLDIVLTTPTMANAASMIQVEAYKKWTLLSLLVYGKAQSMPRNVTNHVSRHCRALCKAYDVLVEAFKETDSHKLRAEIAVGPFAQDCNRALALLVLDAHHRFALISLSRTYASLPLSVAARLSSPMTMSLPETESYISYLISTGQLDASLTTKPVAGAGAGTTADASATETTLRFRSPGSGLSQSLLSSSRNMTTRNEAGMLAELEERRAHVETLGLHAAETQRRIELSKDYVDAVRKWRKAEAKGDHMKSPFGAGGVGEAWGTSVDEDVLADM